MTGRQRPGAMRVFISYAHVDDALRARLRVHLAALEREGLVLAWDDREILAGEHWADVIDERLEHADLVLLLVSPDFVASEYCFGREMRRALERHDDPGDRVMVVPVILRACAWENLPFGKLQALPPNGARPIAGWPNEDAYFTAVITGLRARIGRAVDADQPWHARLGARLRDPLWWQRPRVWGSAALVLALAAVSALAWTSARRAVAAEVSSATTAMRTGRYADAVALLEPACARRLAAGPACFALKKARLGVMLDEPALAIEAFAAQVEALQRLAPGDPDLMLFDAEVAIKEGDPARRDRAFADIRRAIDRTRGDFPEAHFYLANLLLMAGRAGEALPFLDRALQSNRAAPAHYLNARAFARRETGDLAGAERDYEHSAEAGSILSRIELAELLWRDGRVDRAVGQLRAAVEALGDERTPLAGRNALPWLFELEPGRTVMLRQLTEKRCLSRWMWLAGLALAGDPGVEAAPARNSCGPEATRIEAAVAATLRRAAGSGTPIVASRASAFLAAHQMAAAPP